MSVIHKTDVVKSPLLQPVVHRDYTAGFNFNEAAGAKPADTTQKPSPEPEIKGGAPNFTPPLGPTSGPGSGGSQPVDDGTKPFSFDEETDNPSDLGEGDNPSLTMPTGSARTFANFIGNAVQIYLPKASYGYVKIDMSDIRMNIENGYLTLNFLDVFETVNKNSEEALKIPDENIKMWKAAFQHYLEYKQVTFANPETEFWAATALLLGDQGIRIYSLKKTNEKLVREAIAGCNPGIFEKKAPQSNEQKETKNSQKNKSDDSIAA
jgi:hypothetical protein